MTAATSLVDLGGKNHAEVHRYTDDLATGAVLYACRIIYSPGNMTRYELVVARIPSKSEQWLATFPGARDGGSSYWLPSAFLFPSYVYQKWPSHAQADIPHMTRMLRLAQVEMGLVGTECMPGYVREKFLLGWEGVE